MRIECPHCHNGIDVVLRSPAEAVSCPECGSTFSLFDPDNTTSFREPEAQVLGRFRLIEHVGSGHFGDVWRARDATLDREVALKLPRKESLTTADVERFVREARVAAQLHHPSVVAVHEVGQTGDRVFIVSEFIRGLNLALWLADHKPPAAEAARLCAALADALHHAHEAGIVHRDLKPANVLIDPAGQVHLTDFGLAKRDGGEITMTVDGQVLGTPAYMSPEQARGDGHNADRRSDVYSLGVMLFEMLTGDRPFRGSSKVMLIQQVLYYDAPSPRTRNRAIPKDLDTICLKAMEKAPGRRYQTAKEMGDDLRRYLDGKPVLARRITWAERGWRRARRNPAVASLTAVAAVLVVLVGVLAWRGFAGTPGEPAARKVRFTTNPPGARVTFVPIDLDTGNPQPKLAVQPPDVTPLRTKLKPGRYLVVAVIDGHGFHEVYRTVPAPGEEQLKGRYKHQSWTIDKDGVTDLPAIENIPTTAEATAEMVQRPGGEFDAGDDSLQDAPRHRRTVAPFWLAPTEVTIGQYKKIKNSLPDGLAADAKLTGDSDPATYVNYFNALDFAEQLGLRLPTEWEYEFAATNGGTQKYPWGDDASKLSAWPFGPVRTPDFDQTTTKPPIFGLYSGVAEWTDSRFDLSVIKSPIGVPQRILDSNRNSRVIRGGPYAVADGRPERNQWMVTGPRFRKETVREDKGLPGLGFRVARSTEPRFQTVQSKDK